MKVAFMHGPKPENFQFIPKNLPHVFIECPRDRIYSEGQLQQLADCDAIYASGAYVTEQVFAAGRKLKLVQTAGTGYDKIDLEAATRHGVICCNNADMNSSRVADFAMMLAVSLLRNYVPTVVGMDVGRNWETARREGVKALEVEGKTLGIIGFGNIGHKLGRRAHAFDMKVIYHDIDPSAHEDMAAKIGAKRVSREELCRRADVISVHTPLNDRSRHMLSVKEFGLMKEGVFLICTARGDIVDEKALRATLESGKVAAAAIDVFPFEPIRPDNPLVGAPNAFLTPHVAGRGKEGVVRSFNAAIANIINGVKGKRPLNILNPEALPEGRQLERNGRVRQKKAAKTAKTDNAAKANQGTQSNKAKQSNKANPASRRKAAAKAAGKKATVAKKSKKARPRRR